VNVRGDVSATSGGERAAHGPRRRICLFGASADTGNLGLAALMEATLCGLLSRLENPQVTVFDNGIGLRRSTLTVGGEPVEVALRGARIGRRYWLPESLWNMRVSGWLGGLSNPNVDVIDRADAVLDLSGGDSFTDLYGRTRFQLVALPKLVALQRGTPLILLPQTYGPFATARVRHVAARVVRGARMAWARDLDSYAALRDLLGDRFDPARHRRGVDVAFLLESRRPHAAVAAPLEAWLSADPDSPVAGLGVSGLVHGAAGAAERFGLRADYPHVIGELVRRLVADAGARVVLVPHVRGRGAESDDRACEAVVAGLGPTARERVLMLPAGLDAGGTKWLIRHLDWFCGTRMHSTIAALSSGVPSAAIAYSGKTRGVFATCGQEAWVADARSDDTATVVERIWRSWDGRERIAPSLRQRLVPVRAEAEAQMDAIAEACGQRAPDAGPTTGAG
jgi:polysaccharide pyruvyl transferase WcaK-like protein